MKNSTIARIWWTVASYLVGFAWQINSKAGLDGSTAQMWVDRIQWHFWDERHSFFACALAAFHEELQDLREPDLDGPDSKRFMAEIIVPLLRGMIVSVVAQQWGAEASWLDDGVPEPLWVLPTGLMTELIGVCAHGTMTYATTTTSLIPPIMPSSLQRPRPGAGVVQGQQTDQAAEAHQSHPATRPLPKWRLN